MDQVIVRNALPSEISDISRLLFAAYGERGYCSVASATGTEQYFDTPPSLFEGILVAQNKNKIVGTIKITIDSGSLPIDEEFPAEMAAVRNGACKIAYYSRFAVDRDCWSSKEVSAALIAEAICRWKQNGIDAAIMIVHPRHVRFYKLLGFKVIGRSDCAPGLEKAPAVLMVLEKSDVRDAYPQLLRKRFSIP